MSSAKNLTHHTHGYKLRVHWRKTAPYDVYESESDYDEMDMDDSDSFVSDMELITESPKQQPVFTPRSVDREEEEASTSSEDEDELSDSDMEEVLELARTEPGKGFVLGIDRMEDPFAPSPNGTTGTWALGGNANLDYIQYYPVRSRSGHETPIKAEWASRNKEPSRLEEFDYESEESENEGWDESENEEWDESDYEEEFSEPARQPSDNDGFNNLFKWGALEEEEKEWDASDYEEEFSYPARHQSDNDGPKNLSMPGALEEEEEEWADVMDWQ